MNEKTSGNVKLILKKSTISSLESLSEDWLEAKYNPNPYETQEEWKKRRDIMIPLLVKEKLDRYDALI